MSIKEWCGSDFEGLVDYAHRRSLIHYDDGRMWYLLLDDDITLGQLAEAAHSGNKDLFERLTSEGKLIVRRSIRDIPGDDFLVIYFVDAYFMRPYVKR